MRTKLLLAAALTTLMLATAAVPRFAQADGGTKSCFLGTPLCWVTFGASAPVTCPLGTVDVTATADSHGYAYDVACTNGYQGYAVKAAYSVNNRQASEKLTGPGFVLSATWTCPQDPWSTANAPSCINTSTAAKPDLGTFSLPANATGPVFSIQNLDATSLTLLAAQLQNALQLLQPPASPPTPTQSPATQLSRGDTRSISLSTFLPKPDLVAVGISGPTTVFAGMDQTYTATVRNDGADVTGQVDVEIAFVPGFQNLDGAAIAAPGFDCSTSTAATLDCRGGSLAQGQSVAIVFRAYASQSGDATLLLDVNPHSTVAESTTANNIAVLTATIR